ncbi:YtpI family protein [Staphylospora marina]|uniref:YtpI family protein n=1 Tax=Staphylospora marina TaxID=2490858 RepID=UPI000F5BC2C5|nr:YtpI family protein [Staphylospora marina]
MEMIGIILVSLICVAIFGTFYHSILSRRSEGAPRGLHRARMNLYMGLMFLSIGFLQFFLPGTSPLRITLILLILALGAINLYYGWKRLRLYRPRPSRPEENAD